MTPETGDRTDPGGKAAMDWPELLARHCRWLRTVVLARTGEPQAVDDVLQSVAVAAVKSESMPTESAKAAPWLYRVAVRQSLLYRRRLGRQRRLRNRYAERLPTEARNEKSDPLAWLLADEQRQLVRFALARLPGRDAETLLLKYGENWSYSEIANRTGITPDAVRSRLARARDRLRSELLTLGVVDAEMARR